MPHPLDPGHGSVSNETAERLRIQVQAMTDTLEAYAAGRLGWGGFQETISAAFASERKATVERIREALNKSTAADAEWHWIETVTAILDAEAADAPA